MILIPILLCIFTGLLILWLCNQHKYLNIFEQLVLGFVASLSLFVLELFIQGILLNHISLLLPIITFLIILSMFIYKIIKSKGYAHEIYFSIINSFLNIYHQYISSKLRKRYIMLGIIIYVLIKVVMVFSINLNRPTFDDDAVTTRDFTTKIFIENKSLVLNNASPEYFGADYAKYPFAGIADTYLLLSNGVFVNGLSNIISPLMYFFTLLLLLGIFTRKTNLFVAMLSWYVFSSLPFVFIHGAGAYWNFQSGIFLFIFVFYLIDQLFNINKEYLENNQILIPIVLVGFLSSVIRNEGLMLTGVSFLVIITLYHIFKKHKLHELKYQFLPLIPILLGYILNKIIFNFYPSGAIAIGSGQLFNNNLLNDLFKNIREPGVFVAPFQQMFYHPDYILLFLLFVISFIVFFVIYKKMKEIWIFFSITILLLFIFMFILYANFQLLGLLTHFAFIRYPVSIVLFLIYTIIYTIYLLSQKFYNKS